MNKADDKDIRACREAFKPFLELNPQSRLELIEDDEHGERLRIVQPWGDKSVTVILPPDYSALARSLSYVYLPERYSALYHSDIKEMEIIFSSFPLGPDLEGISTRRFTFIHKGQHLECRFAPASPRLQMLARHSYPTAQSATQYRNLLSFHIRSNTQERENYERYGVELGDPLCFWIKNIEWDENRILSLIREINFYSHYYDQKAPQVLIHSPMLESVAEQPQLRFREGSFPSIISARDIDENLMRFWSASLSGNPANRFLYSYRLIEYASLLYLERGSKDRIKRIVAAPSALSDIDKLTESVIAVIQSTNIDSASRIEALLRDVITEDALWTEISRNSSAFEQAVVFEGGFTLEPLVKGAKDAKSFGQQGIASFAKRLRDIRNALAHGRDQKSTLPLAPTRNNFERLQPWASIIGYVASEIIVYRSPMSG